MGKWKITDLEKEALQKFWKYKSLEYSTSIEDARIIVRNQILTGLFTSNKLQEKIKGMMFRNQIHSSTYIDSDILQNTFMELSKSNKDEMFIAFCDDPSRILGLAVTITKLGGFSNLNDDSHPNKSMAKKILYGSNLKQRHYISTTEDTIIYNDDERIKSIFPHQMPDIDLDTELMNKVRLYLNDEEIMFLNFLLSNVFNKKYSSAYSYTLRKVYSFNEYKIRRIHLQNRIKDIIKKLNNEN